MKRLIDAEIKRETEKACLLNVTVDTSLGLKGINIWLPKSQIKVDDEGVFAEEWIIKSKNREIPFPSSGILIA